MKAYRNILITFCISFLFLGTTVLAAPDGEEILDDLENISEEEYQQNPDTTYIPDEEIPEETTLPAVQYSSNIFSYGNTRIHFICLPDATDAILLESNGHFGMVDSGEDTDYPSGNDPRYPFRSGIVTNRGFEHTVINYLKEVGVTSLDFYIGTHAHSDHIGSGDEIFDTFSVDRLYLAEYDDSYITLESRLWDNQYVYDQLMETAEYYGTEIIQDFNEESTRIFQLGDMTIEIMNYERDLDENGNIIPQFDDNNNSLGVKVSAYGQTAFLAGDINNYNANGTLDYQNGDETKLASQLGRIDLLKLGHHGYSGSNTEGYLNTLSPTNSILTGRLTNLGSTPYNQLLDLGSTIYSTYWYDTGAIIADFSSSGISVSPPQSGAILTTGRPDESRWVFFENGLPVLKKNSWINYDNNWYYGDSTGYLVTGWLSLNDNWYYLNSNAVMQTGWLQLNNIWYYLKPSGIMATGWTSISNSWYYFNTSGVMQTGAVKISGKTYILDSSGRMKSNGWVQVNGTWYYADKNGIAASGWLKIGSSWYYFNSAGAMQTGSVKVGSKTYILDSSGKMRTDCWVKVGSTWYYPNKDGVATTGWLKKGSTWYYLNSSGAMATGWAKVSGTWYYMKSSGAMATGWVKDNNTWYYMKSSGAMATGWHKINKTWYHLKSSGAMTVGWYKSGNTWYYMKSSGAMATGWIKDNGTWYYMNSSGAMLSNTSQKVNGKTYKFNKSGACTNP